MQYPKDSKEIEVKMESNSQKSKPVSVRLIDHHIQFGDRQVPLLSGEIHYWLHPALHWKDILLAIKNCSLPMVATYVPWNFHQLENGTFDFVGLTDPQRDLATFLDLTAELGLTVFIRPGPWIYAHFADGGIPIEASNFHRLDKRFLGMARNYLSELCKILRPRLATRGGNIVICQVDNEIDPLPALRGRSGGTRIPDDPIGDTYFEQTINGSYEDRNSFRSWLERRYRSIEAFNQKTGISFGSWDKIDVSSLIAQKGSVIKPDLLAYLEWYSTKYAAEIATIMSDEGIDIPFVLNTYADMEPQNNCQFGQIAEIVGGDYWGKNLLPWESVLRISRHVRHLRCSVKTPFSPEFQSISAGELIHVEGVVTPQNATYLSLLAMLLGLKGWNWFTFAERSVCYFAPVNNYGGILHDYYDRFKQMHDEFLSLDWPSFQSCSDCSLWFYRPDFWTNVQYAESVHTPHAHFHSEYDAGAWMDWFEQLQLMDFDIEMFDPHGQYNSISPGTTLVYCGHNSVELPAQEQLVDLVRQGLHLVFLSAPPTFDLCGNSTSVFEFLPQPVHVEGRNSNLNIKFMDTEYEFSSDYLALYEISEPEEQILERFECQFGTCGYILQTGNGKIAILGFKPSRDIFKEILEVLGVEPAVQSNADKVITAAYCRGNEKAVVVVNTNEYPVDTNLTLNAKRLQLDSETSFRVSFRLARESMVLKSDALGELHIALPPKTGEIIHISPSETV